MTKIGHFVLGFVAVAVVINVLITVCNTALLELFY